MKKLAYFIIAISILGSAAALRYQGEAAPPLPRVSAAAAPRPQDPPAVPSAVLTRGETLARRLEQSRGQLQQARQVLEAQQRLLDRIDSVERAFDDGKLSVEDYLAEKREIAAELGSRS